MVQKASTQKLGFYEEKGALKNANLTRDLTDADVRVDVDLTVAKLPLPRGMNFEEKYNEMLVHFSKLFNTTSPNTDIHYHYTFVLNSHSEAEETA